MSISMERFGAEGSFAKFTPAIEATPRVAIFSIQCRACGYEPEDTVVAPRVCPKCHSKSWERYAKPGSILTNADRYDRVR